MMRRFNAFIEKWMAFVSPLCLITGVLFPEIATHGIPFVPYLFAFMTFTGGLKSSFADMAGVLKRPFPLLLSMAVLHIAAPLLALGAGTIFFGHNPNVVTGMVLEFVVPSAVVGLMWVSIYNGSSPLSLSIVILDTIIAPFSIPLTLRLLLGSSVQLEAASMMRELLFMIALPAVAAMCLNQATNGQARKTLPGKLAPWSKLCLMAVIISNSSKVAPYIRHMTLERVLVAFCIFLLAAAGYAIGWLIAKMTRQDRETTISMIYGSGMRNISAGAVIASSYFPAEVLFPVMVGTLFQQILAACYGTLIVKRLGRSAEE